MPPSVRRSVTAKLDKSGLDVSVEPADEEQRLAIQAALEHAQALYDKKRERARIAAAAKRAGKKASKAQSIQPEPAIEVA